MHKSELSSFPSLLSNYPKNTRRDGLLRIPGNRGDRSSGSRVLEGTITDPTGATISGQQ